MQYYYNTSTIYVLQGFSPHYVSAMFCWRHPGQMRVLIQTGSQVVASEIGHGATIPQEAINLIFAGAFVEVVSLASYT